MPAQIAPWDGTDAELDEVAELYAAAFAEPPYGDDVDASRASIIERVRRRAETKHEFRLLLAREGSELAGFVLGTDIAAGDWWRDRIARLMSAEQSTAWLGNECFAVEELAVSPAHRRTGVAGALMTAAIAELPYETAVLGCYENAVGATRLYASLGWQRIATETLSDATAVHILGRRLMASGQE